jgi:hypothetical protein
MRSHEVLLCTASVALMALPPRRDRFARASHVPHRPLRVKGARPKVFCKASELMKYDVENDKGDDIVT